MRHEKIKKEKDFSESFARVCRQETYNKRLYSWVVKLYEIFLKITFKIYKNKG